MTSTSELATKKKYGRVYSLCWCILMLFFGIGFSQNENNRFIPGKLPDGFVYAQIPEYYGTYELPQKNGTIFDFIDGGGYHPQQRLTRIITDTAAKIINLASLKCVEGDFVASLFLKNHIGSLMDSDMSRCHGNPDFLAEVNARPSIRQKTILNLCDGLRGTYRRGVPWYWAGIIMGKDPVTSEYAAIQVMNEKRRIENVSLLEIPEHLRIAENKYKLGTWNPSKIEILKI